ncbi:hypothetical protein A5881_002278 [Enterococcus termitis]|nr:hypothetical protein A5881_001402 [Enterococcus termitis]
MTLTSQQRFDDQNYQFRNQLEELQEAQRDNKKDQQFIEQMQERFYALQQQEQRIYQESLNEVESEESAFFEERQDDSFHLSRQALQEFEEEQEQLAQDRKTLLEKEDSVRSAHRNFLKTEEKEMSNGT